MFLRDFAEVPKFCHIRLDESEPDANSQMSPEANSLSNSQSGYQNDPSC